MKHKLPRTTKIVQNNSTTKTMLSFQSSQPVSSQPNGAHPSQPSQQTLPYHHDSWRNNALQVEQSELAQPPGQMSNEASLYDYRKTMKKASFYYQYLKQKPHKQAVNGRFIDSDGVPDEMNQAVEEKGDHFEGFI